jgi:hypothetical protein
MGPDSRHESQRRTTVRRFSHASSQPSAEDDPLPLPDAEDFPGVEVHIEEPCDAESGEVYFRVGLLVPSTAVTLVALAPVKRSVTGGA